MKDINLGELAELCDSGVGLGIGGSRYLTSYNKKIVDKLLNTTEFLTWLDQFDFFVSGGAIGIDAHVLDFIHQRFSQPCITIEPSNKKFVDKKIKKYSTHRFMMPDGTDYKERNAMVVNSSHAFLAMPMFDEDNEPRSGTWQAVRQARVANISVFIYILTYEEEIWESRSVSDALSVEKLNR